MRGDAAEPSQRQADKFCRGILVNNIEMNKIGSTDSAVTDREGPGIGASYNCIVYGSGW